MNMSSKISGTGTFIPSIKKENNAFLNEHFLNEDGSTFSSENKIIIEKFKGITGIKERRYAKPEYQTSDLAFFAAQKAIKDANVNQEELNYIIVAHNFGDLKKGAIQGDMLPSL
ncbi:MAG: 3-oxoacyl-[acyl-carrier-protein] synthase-3, partial [Flavobacterium sp.]